MKRSVVDVAGGLFLMRYKSSAVANPPLVTFGGIAGGTGRLNILEQPGAIAGSLERPGDVGAEVVGSRTALTS